MRGSVSQRSKGSWEIRLELPPTPDGKRQRRTETFRGTKRDAEKRLAELLHQADTGSLARPGKLTVAQFLTTWLRDYAAMSVRPRTYEGYAGKIRVHVLPALGVCPTNVQARR